MKTSTRPSPAARRRHAGFTLTELLVAIAIVIVLAALAFALLRSARTAAARASCVNRLRQVAGLLVSTAGDHNGRLQLFRGGSGAFELRPYFVVRDELNLPTDPYEAHYSALREVMFCPTAPEPGSPHWNCYGVNFTNNERAGATWIDEQILDAQGRSANASTLTLAAVGSPSNYPLVADSCTADGQQIFRIRGTDRIGLRHDGRANAGFLDGSARSLTKQDLANLGFKDVYDTSTKPPKVVDLPIKPN